jgi:hypothetical protein
MLNLFENVWCWLKPGRTNMLEKVPLEQMLVKNEINGFTTQQLN